MGCLPRHPEKNAPRQNMTMTTGSMSMCGLIVTLWYAKNHRNEHGHHPVQTCSGILFLAPQELQGTRYERGGMREYAPASVLVLNDSGGTGTAPTGLCSTRATRRGLGP